MTSSGKVLECGGPQDVRLQFKNIKVAALPNKGLFQKEPYLSFEVEGGTKGRTLPAPNAEAPFWAEGVAILVPAHSKKNLVITVHNKHNILLPDTFVGQVSVPLNQIEAGGSLQHYPLHNKKDEQSGDISLEMQVLPPGEGGTTQQEGGPDAAAPADPAVSPAAGTAGMSGGGASQINRDVGPNSGSGTMPNPHGPGTANFSGPEGL